MLLAVYIATMAIDRLFFHQFFFFSNPGVTLWQGVLQIACSLCRERLPLLSFPAGHFHWIKPRLVKEGGKTALSPLLTVHNFISLSHALSLRCLLSALKKNNQIL